MNAHQLVQESHPGLVMQPDLTLVCFSDDWDKLYAAFTLAAGAAAMGRPVHMFFTFWGAMAIRNGNFKPAGKRSVVERLFHWMLGGGTNRASMSKMNFLGLSRWMMEREMRRKNIASLALLIEETRELGAHFYCCETSARIFGWTQEELESVEGFEVCGAAGFLEKSETASTTLFI